MQRIAPTIRYVRNYIWPTKQLEGLYQFDHHKSETEVRISINSTEEIPIQNDPLIQPLVATASPEEISPKRVIMDYTTFIFSEENRLRIFAASLLTTLGTALNFLAPYILGNVINSLTRDEEASETEGSQLWLITWLVLVYTMAQLVPNFRDRLLIPVAANNTKKLLSRITANQLNKSLRYHIDTDMSNQIYLVQKGFVVSEVGTPLLTKVGPTLLEGAIAVTALSCQYGVPIGVGLTTVLAAYTTYSAMTTKPIIDARENNLMRGREAWKSVNDAITQYKTIHDFNKFPETMKTVETALELAAQAEIRADSIPLTIGLGHITIPRAGMLGAMLYIGSKVQTRQFTIAELVALFGYLNQLSGSLPAVGDALNKVISSYPDLRFVFNELAKPSEIIDPHPDTLLQVNGPASIRFENINFNYPGKERTLNNLSLAIQPGQTIAIVSESGGGKSTLFNLLYGYYTPASGRILINNQDIAQTSRASLQENIGLAGQNPNLFNGSVRENIKFGAKNPDAVTDVIIFELAKNLNLLGFICSLAEETTINLESFSKGLNCAAGEGGKKLSVGQQQKVAILRGFMKNTPIRLLDEITASLDADSISTVLAGVKTLTANATTLIITHHLTEITSADQIFVLDKGTVIAQGTHQELLQTCALYKNLWMKQHKENGEHAAPSVTNPMGMFPKSGKDHPVRTEGVSRKLSQSNS